MAEPQSTLACDGDCPIVSCLTGSCFDANSGANQSDEQKEDEPKTSYGPCDCQPRKTLLQWSYGTTFSGGPPGMDEPLEADRPGFTISPVTVGKGVVQLETGYTFTLDNAGGIHQVEHDFPDTLWRIGMFADWFEWRIEYNYSIIDNTINNPPIPPIHQHFSGSQDLLLGCKLCLTPQEGILPEMGFLPQMSVPSGAPNITAGQVLPGLLWGYQWQVNKIISITGLTAITRAVDDVGTIFTEFDQALSVQYQLTPKLQGYTEWYVIAPNGRTTERTQHYADGGFAYHVTNNLQLDAECGVGLNAAANNFFAGSGAVVRF
ncbi:MAG TPA: transporter [Pirellulales bacterium]|nr:transporter [Pirellulales bacterium]